MNHMRRCDIMQNQKISGLTSAIFVNAFVCKAIIKVLSFRFRLTPKTDYMRLQISARRSL
jgi:hypothetical protein